MFRKTTFKDFVTLQRGFDLPAQQREEGDYPVVASTSITGTHSEWKVEPPGVVTGRSGALGEVQYITTRFWPLNTALWVKDFKSNDPHFVYYKLRTLDLKRFNSGAGVPTLNRNDLDTLELEIPDLPTQRRIASILSAYDDLIENNTRRIAILEEMARRIYEEWFVRFRFPGHEQVKMVESELGLIPEGWPVVSVGDAVAINPTVRVPKDGLKPFVPMGCLSENSMLVTDWEEREGNSGSKFQNGDTLFARITPCLENGKTGYVQFLPASDAVAFGSTEFIVLRSKSLCPEYVYLLARLHAFRENAIKSMSGATGRQRVREACFDTFFIAQPDAETLRRFQQVVAPMFSLIQQLERKNANLRATRDLLLPKLISGELDVGQLAA